MQGRRLPEPLVRFILGPWQRLLKQAAVTTAGGDQDALRRAGKLLEWLVWVGDPQLSEVDRNRLYHVGEQLGDRMLEVWHQVFDQPLAHDQLNEVETILVARLRGDALALVDAFGPPNPFTGNLPGWRPRSRIPRPWRPRKGAGSFPVKARGKSAVSSLLTWRIVRKSSGPTVPGSSWVSSPGRPSRTGRLRAVSGHCPR